MFSFSQYKARKELTQHISRLRRYAHVLCRDANDSDDLVQATLERALTHLAQWKAGTDMRAWLFTIMHNVFINQLRKQNRDEKMITDQDLDQFPAPASEQHSIINDIEAGLEKLPTDQREVLILIGIEELSYRQAADILSVPVGTVMSRLNRARKRLREIVFKPEKPALRSVK